MHRLFIAIRPPSFIRAQLLDVMGGVNTARWQSDDQLHLTLRFIGEVDRHCAQDVAAALASVVGRSFSISLQGAGHFGRGSRGGSLWIGVAPHEPLVALHKKVDEACRRAGLPSESRAYLPHITVARMGRDAGSIDAFLQTASATASDPFVVDAFYLYESRLGSGDALYEIAERYRLG